MKLITLQINGVNASEVAYDFGNKAAGCAVLENVDKNVLRDGLVYAFYGVKPESAPSISVELAFELEGAEYRLTRSAAGVKLTVDDSETNGSDADAFLAKKMGMDASAFADFMFIDRSVAEALASDTVTRESFVAERMSGLTTSEGVRTKRGELLAEERSMVDHIASIDEVTREDIKDQQLAVDSAQTALDDAREQVEAVKIDLGIAAKYQDELTAYYEAVAKMDALNARKDEMAELADRAAKSAAAAELAEVFEKYDTVKKELSDLEFEMKRAIAERDTLIEKVEAGEHSIQTLGNEYIAEAEREKALRAAIKEVITQGVNHPEAVAAIKGAESYYLCFEEEKNTLTERKSVLEKDANDLIEKLNELTKRKAALQENADYKLAVRRGAIAEGRIIDIEAAIAASEARVERAGANRAALIESNKELARAARTRKAEVSKLEREIKGGYETVEQAVNAAVLYKQTIYMKHLWVSRNEVELDAVVKKIESVKAAREGYAEKAKTLVERRDAVVEHKSRLTEKLALLNEKLMDYLSYNHLRKISSEVEYGGHCPLCDGFVSIKKELPLRDTKAIDDQIKAVEAEIKKDEALIIEAESGIGQFEAAATVSAQYLEALNATKEAKERAINKVLKEYKVATIAELFEMVGKVAEEGNLLTQKMDVYRKASGELMRLEEANAIVVKQIENIDKEVLPAENEVLENLRAELAEFKEQYDAGAEYFNGESAIALSEKLAVEEKELDEVEAAIAQYDEQFTQVEAELTAVNTRLDDILNHRVPVEVNGVMLNYGELIAKLYSDYLLAIKIEIEKAMQAKENIKLRIAGTRKVVNDIKAQLRAARANAAAAQATYEATSSTIRDLYSDYEEKFREIGLTKREDIAVLVLDDATMAECRSILYAYDEDVAATKEKINLYKSEIDAHAGVYENYEDNLEQLETLKEEEAQAVMNLGNAMIILADMERRHKEISDCNKKLGYIRSRLKGIEDLMDAVKDGAILAGDLSRLILERADAIARKVSDDRYSVGKDESDGTVKLVGNGKVKIHYDRLTLEEKALLPLALSAAYNEVMVALLAGNLYPALEVKAEECDKQSIAPILAYSEMRELVILSEGDSFLAACNN